jgi:hypothetical protein
LKARGEGKWAIGTKNDAEASEEGIGEKIRFGLGAKEGVAGEQEICGVIGGSTGVHAMEGEGGGQGVCGVIGGSTRVHGGERGEQGVCAVMGIRESTCVHGVAEVVEGSKGLGGRGAEAQGGGGVVVAGRVSSSTKARNSS